MANNINLNTNPYYDDFNDDKQYQRILFKPGYAVQARELTQMQTMLQKQVERFGNHIFKEGAVITGCDYALNLKVPYVKILDTDSGAVTIDNADLEGYEGEILVNSTTGLKAVIKKSTQGFESTIHKTFHVQYINQGTNNTTTTFSAGDTLALESDNSITFVIAGAGTTPIGYGSLFSLNDGIIYGKGTFVIHKAQTVVLEAFSSTPSKSVGVNIVETIVDSEIDTTLRDPATGTYNYTAPGADRLKVSTELKSFDTNASVSDEFNILFDIVLGKVARRYDVTDYGELNKVLARRTYDESGDYTIRPFGLNVREHLIDGDNGGLYTSGNGGDAGKLALGISAGKAYVKGYEYQTYATQYFDVEKETETRDIEDANISTAYGYYVIIDDVRGISALTPGTLLQLQDTARNAKSSNSTTNTSSLGASGSAIGTARVVSLEYNSGTIGQAACQYKLYLSEIKMTSGSFADVRSFYYGTGDRFHADIAGATAELQDTSFSSLVFPLPERNISTLDIGAAGYNNAFIYRKKMTGTVSTAGAVTFSLSGDETFAFTADTTTNRTNEIILIASDEMKYNSAANTAYYEGDVIPLGTAAATSTGVITGLTSTSLTIDVTSETLDATYGITAFVSVRKTDTSPRSKTLRAGRLVKLQTSRTFSGGTVTNGSATITGLTSVTDNASVGDKVYKSSDNSLVGTISSVTSTTIVLTSTYGGSTFSADILVCHPNYNPATNSLEGPLSLGFYDVFKINSITTGSSSTAYASLATDSTDIFELNSGQTDTLYDLSSISKKNKETFNFSQKRFLINLDYFEHSASASLGGYFSVDSYPLPVQGTAAGVSEIEWTEIPQYITPNAVKINLRDVLDFRSTVTQVSNNTTSEGSASINPVAYTETSKTLLTGIYIPHAQEEFITDVQYNIGRIDRVILNSEGEFEVMTGVPDITPIAPPQPGNAMTLGIITIPPFPSTSPKVARSLDRRNFGTTVTLVENRRYTMRDISQIDKRLTDLQQYTELSFLEQKLLNSSLINSNGDERPKNGVLVDDFNDHSKGAVDDPSYSCTIFNGFLQPSLKPTNVELEVATISNLVQNSKNMHIVVEQVTTADEYVVGEVVSNGSGASGTVAHVVTLATDYTTGYRWVRLYLDSATVGTSSFAVSNTVTGATSTAVGTIPTISSTTNISATLLPIVLRPDAIVETENGKLITLPYTHKLYAENPYASEAINTTNKLLFNYEGNISLTPMADTWFDEENTPEGDSYILPTSGNTSWFASVAAPPKAAVSPTASSSPPPSDGGGSSGGGGGGGGGVETRIIGTGGIRPIDENYRWDGTTQLDMGINQI